MKSIVIILVAIGLFNADRASASSEQEQGAPFFKQHWSDEEAGNVELVWDLMDNLLIKRKYDYVKEQYSDHRYEQHSVTFEDGIDGLVKGVQELEDRFPGFSFDLKDIHADGKFVIFHSHLTFDSESRGNDKRGMIVVDKWRVADGEIVEHWDSLQPLERKISFIYLLLGNPENHSNGIF